MVMDLVVEARIEDTSSLVIEDCIDEDNHGDLVQKVVVLGRWPPGIRRLLEGESYIDQYTWLYRHIFLAL